MKSKLLNRRGKGVLLILGFASQLFWAYGREDIFPHSGERLTSERVSINDTLDLDYRKALFLPEASLSLELTEIISDSRCPVDGLVLCVWMGEIEFKLDLVLRGEKITITHAFQEGNQEVNTFSYENYLFTLLDFQPESLYDVIIRPEEYRLQLVVTEK